MHSYSHPQYLALARRDVLEAAVRDKTYPFDTRVDINLRELGEDEQFEMLPRAIWDSRVGGIFGV